MIVTVVFEKEAWKKKLKAPTAFEPMTSTLTGAMLYQVNCEFNIINNTLSLLVIHRKTLKGSLFSYKQQ